MSKRYTNGNRVSSSQHALSRNKEIRIANFVLRNQDITQRNLGFVLKNNPVWTDDIKYRIAEFSNFLRNAIIVDSSSVEISRNGFLDEQFLKTGYVLDREIEPRSMPALAILPRPDIKVFLFLEEKDLQSFGKRKSSEKVRIIVNNGIENIILYGLSISQYSVIPLQMIRSRYFFVILPKII